MQTGEVGRDKASALEASRPGSLHGPGDTPELLSHLESKVEIRNLM